MNDRHTGDQAFSSIHPPREIEIKLRVNNLAAVRCTLASAGATFLESVLECNDFFDRPDESLRKVHCGLRIRTFRHNDAIVRSALLTWKGPAGNSAMHNRPSIDLLTQPAELAHAFLLALGFVRTSGFEKRRESWQCAGCRVELDELPHLGTYVEIEGPDESAVHAVQKQLSLGALENVPETYHGMVANYLRQYPVADNTLRF